MTTRTKEKPMIRHADRCVFFRRPASDDDLANDLTDAVTALRPGQMLVYRVGPVVQRSVPGALFMTASAVAGRLDLPLVQWPNGPADDAGRTWCWAIQKPGTLAA